MTILNNFITINLQVDPMWNIHIDFARYIYDSIISSKFQVLFMINMPLMNNEILDEK